jgi:DNA-binding response OmpR family regulator
MKEYQILLVDDDPNILTVIGYVLEDKGYQVTTASSGEVAIEALSIKDFDLVITDLNMHETDGIAVLKKAKKVNSDCGVMILTGSLDPSLAIEALRLDADDYMSKPCDPSELLERVANCIETSELEHGRAHPDSCTLHDGTTPENIEPRL